MNQQFSIENICNLKSNFVQQIFNYNNIEKMLRTSFLQVLSHFLFDTTDVLT